jgi:hypothetical protein
MGRKAQKNDSLPGSLDMLILRTLSLRDLHGYGMVQFNRPTMSYLSRRARCTPLSSGWS